MNEPIKIDRQFVDDIRGIIDRGIAAASSAVANTAIATYWNIGKRIVEEEQAGAARAQYGKKIIPALADELKLSYGGGYGKRNLAYYRKFYLAFPDTGILHTCVQNLSWSHIRLLIHVEDEEARMWYMREASEEMWSVRTLERNVTTQYYGRRLASQREHLPLPAPAVVEQSAPEAYIKNPLVAEFLGFNRNSNYTETELEQALIDNLQHFIMELGRGFAFVDRQKHIRTELGDFYADLVFYNYRMKRFVIFELKTHALSHADVGQLDMYVRIYDDLVKGEDDNPTVGVLLCTDTDKTIAKYSVLHDSEQLYAAKYMAYMPTEEELLREIEQQKRFFLEQHNNNQLEEEKE